MRAPSGPPRQPPLPTPAEPPRPPPPRGGLASTLLRPPPDPGPAPLTPRRTRVTIRETRATRPGIRIGSYRIHVLDVVTVVLGIAVLLAIFWPR
jgi:hypothetical protein